MIAPDRNTEVFPRAPETQERLASWYTQGISDGLGDRLLMFDNTGAASWELLRFRPELAATSGFETALRNRVEQLSRFRHQSFPTVRVVDDLDIGSGLVLVSTYASGRRLSEVLEPPRRPSVVMRLIRQLSSALAALQQQGGGIAHGALTVDRILVTTDGQIIIREHVLGSALQRLRLPPSRLWTDLGIVVPTNSVPTLDGCTDVIQLGLITLALILGRRIGPDEYPDKVDQLLDQVAASPDWRSAPVFPPFRRWLERALQLNGPVFASALDANEALLELPADAHRAEGSGRVPLTLHRNGALRHLVDPESTRPWQRREASLKKRDEIPRLVEGRVVERSRLLRWTAAAVTLVAIGEMFLIARLLYTRSFTPPADTAIVIEAPQAGADVLVDGRPAGVTPLELKIGSRTRSIQVLSHEAPTSTKTKEAGSPDAGESPRATQTRVDDRMAGRLRTAAVPERSGRVLLTSPINLDIFEDGRQVGSSAGVAIVTTAGRHEFELVNGALGYHARRAVDVEAGQIVSLSVIPANGSISINALPWANVWIDGRSVGETPLAHLAVPLGEHEIVFRHPELGERRETAIVRSDSPTRVSVNLRP